METGEVHMQGLVGPFEVEVDQIQLAVDDIPPVVDAVE
jgi:hypothetical protein